MSYTGFLSDAMESLALRPRAPSPYAEELLGVLSREVIPNLAPGEYRDGRTRNRTLIALARELGTSYPQVVGTLTQLLLEGRTTDAAALIATQERRPLPLTIINLDMLAPCATLLGLLWEKDLCDFNDVTVGVMQLQDLMRQLSRHANDLEQPSGHHHRILLAPAEGEDHTFGLCMLGDFMMRAGWDVGGGPGVDRVRVLTLLRTEHYDLAGFTIADERWLPVLQNTITEARAASCNGALKILVGGPLLHKLPRLATTVGADGSASDAPAALRLAARMVDHRRSAAAI